MKDYTVIVERTENLIVEVKAVSRKMAARKVQTLIDEGRIPHDTSVDPCERIASVYETRRCLAPSNRKGKK